MSREEKRMIAVGRGEVTRYESQPYDNAGDFVMAVVNVAGEYSGDMAGAGSSRFILATEAGSGAVRFTGMEKFTGTLCGDAGTFIFENSGRLENGVLCSTWQIIPGSGTGALEGLRGEGSCDPGGYRLTYWLDESE